MTRKSKQQKINNLEDQIKELEERKKQMQDDLYKSIGKTVVTAWGCNDDKILISTVEKLKDNALKLISEATKSENNSNILED